MLLSFLLRAATCSNRTVFLDRAHLDTFSPCSNYSFRYDFYLNCLYSYSGTSASCRGSCDIGGFFCYLKCLGGARFELECTVRDAEFDGSAECTITASTTSTYSFSNCEWDCSNGLSTGAIIGIVIGCLAVIGIVIGSLVCIFVCHVCAEPTLANPAAAVVVAGAPACAAGYPPQGYAAGYPQTGYQTAGAPPGYSQPGAPPQGYPPQGYPPQGYPPGQVGYPGYPGYPPR
jgi:hypothetical protein